jgi:hypothetical protein
MKRVGWLLVAVLVALAAWQLKGRSQHEQTSTSAAPVKAGTWQVLPAEPRVNNTLQVQMAGEKFSPEPVSCRWFKNGMALEGETNPTLAPGRFKRGDEIVAEVTGAPGAPAQRTAPVTIVNSAPRIVAASADLRTEPSASLFVQVSAIDADNDDVALSYQWYRNGKLMPGATRPTVDVSSFEMGDEVHAEVTASDGHESSGPQNSDPIRIGSNAPEITSTPPTSLDGARRFVYQLQVRAPQPKALRYQLIDAPEGMSIDESGLIEWTMPALSGDAHTYEVVVRVSDPTGGEAEQRFRLSESLQRGSNE